MDRYSRQADYICPLQIEKKNNIWSSFREVFRNVIIEKNNTDYNDDDEIYELFKKALDECSKDDDDLQLYVIALDECNSFDEMSGQLGWDKKKLYSLQQKLTRRVIKYLETNKKLAR